LVQDGIHDAFAERLGQAVAALRVGPGMAAGVTTGPLINAAAVRKVRDHVDNALTKGARIAAQAPGGGDPTRFTAPVVLTGATVDMRLAHEETFGPVAPLFRFESEDEAVTMANATPYGLASYFYTNDLHRAWRVSERLEAGMVALNTGSIAMEMSPFGGVKQSGLGREGGQAGIEEYLEQKAFHIGGLKLGAVP
ncbi:aldehyde dehydrogenase family protein, partial [Nitrospirillum viridazoti]